MKKIYVCLVGLLAAGTVMAQKNSPVLNAKKNSTVYEKVQKGHVSQAKAILWQNDFSTQSDWTTVLNNGTADAWVLGTSVPSGSFAISPIASTTAANGYALYDSDLLCSGDQDADVRIVTPIDLTGNVDVKIEFESFYRKFQGNCYVIASTDGVNWTEFEVHTSLAVNGSSANPEVIQVNLSSVIGGSATAYIGFRYKGGCDYAWMVDDVKIATLDNYDLEMTNVYWGSTGFWGARLPYYQIPIAQIAPIDFGGIVSNLGSTDQNDVVFTASLTGGVYTGSSAASTVLAGTLDTLDVTTQLTPPASAANHVVNLAVTSSATDANLANNTIASAATIAVNNFIYARDKGTISGGSFNQGQGFEVGNIFDMYAAATLKGIDVVIHPQAVAGAEMYVKLYSIDPATGDFLFVDESAPYALTTANLGQKITLTLSGPVQLNANESYLIVAGSNGDGGATDDLIVGTAGVSEAQTSFYLDLTDNTWYYTSSTPMVRMNFDQTVSINEVENTFGLNVYPNPANEVINVSLSKSTNATISVVDVAGKVVKTSSINGLTSTINASDLTNGVYYVTITDGTSVATEKVVIKK
jgi:hypothetical protein